MSLLYQIGIVLYVGLIRFVALFNHKASLWVQGRKNWKIKLKSAIDEHRKVYWFHAASLGEFEQARPLMEQLKKEQPDIFVLVTFFSPSGYEVRKNYQGADYVCYLPADTPQNARQFIDIVKPYKAFFIKYEFWFNYLRALNRNHIDLYLVSGVFSPRQIFFKPYGKWFRRQLSAFRYFFLQDISSQESLKQLGYKNSMVTGDTRFDRVIAVSKQPQALPLIKNFVSSQTCLVVGSSWAKDEDLLIHYINRNSDYKYIIAPHEVHEGHIQQIMNQLSVPFLRWSDLKKHETLSSQKVLIIDEIGILNSVYQFADVAYVGGAFGTGLHNILEPAVYGLPVIFGNQHHKFPEAQALIDAGGGFSIENQNDLDVLLNRFLGDKEAARRCGGKSKDFIYQGEGATDTIITHL